MYGSHTARKSRLAAGPSSSATSANVRRTSPPTPRRSSPGRPLRQRPFWSSAMTLPDGDAEALSSAPTRTAAASAISGHTDSATNADGRAVAPGLRTGAPASVRPTSASMRAAACWRSGSRLAQSDRGLAFGRQSYSQPRSVPVVKALVTPSGVRRRPRAGECDDFHAIARLRWPRGPSCGRLFLPQPVFSAERRPLAIRGARLSAKGMSDGIAAVRPEMV